MSACISRGLRIACAIGLAASLIGACSSPNEERDLPACDGTTYVLESAVRYQLIEGFSGSSELSVGDRVLVGGCG